MAYYKKKRSYSRYARRPTYRRKSYTRRSRALRSRTYYGRRSYRKTPTDPVTFNRQPLYNAAVRFWTGQYTQIIQANGAASIHNIRWTPDLTAGICVNTGTGNYAGFDDAARNYTRFKLLGSYIRCTVTNADTASPLQCVLYASRSTTADNNPQERPGNVNVMLGAAGLAGADAQKTIRFKTSNYKHFTTFNMNDQNFFGSLTTADPPVATAPTYSYHFYLSVANGEGLLNYDFTVNVTIYTRFMFFLRSSQTDFE